MIKSMIRFYEKFLQVIFTDYRYVPYNRLTWQIFPYPLHTLCTAHI